MRVLVSGDKGYADASWLWSRLSELHRLAVGGITMIIEGEAKGADLMARAWAEHYGIPFEPYPADWDGKLGIRGKAPRNAAGPIRNRQMLREGKPDLVVAFHDHFEDSRGTKDMIEQAQKAGVPVLFYDWRRW